MSYAPEDNPSYTLEEIEEALRETVSYMDCWGEHTGCVRQWMQQKFVNGDKVMWGSDEPLSGSGLTPRVMENLAQEIKDRVCKQLRNDFYGRLGDIKVRRTFTGK